MCLLEDYEPLSSFGIPINANNILAWESVTICMRYQLRCFVLACTIVMNSISCDSLVRTIGIARDYSSASILVVFANWNFLAIFKIGLLQNTLKISVARTRNTAETCFQWIILFWGGFPLSPLPIFLIVELSCLNHRTMVALLFLVSFQIEARDMHILLRCTTGCGLLLLTGFSSFPFCPIVSFNFWIFAMPALSCHQGPFPSSSSFTLRPTWFTLIGREKAQITAE